MSMPTSHAPGTDPRLQAVRRLGPWFHNLHLPGGLQTAPDHPLGDFPQFKWAVIAPLLPADLSGWHVLDIGCNAGLYSIELARRGARVTAIDVNLHYLAQARWAAREFGVERAIDLRHLQVYDLARMRERFDLVLFLGVFYHLRYPLLGLDLAARRTRRLFLFQSLSLPGDEVAPVSFDRDLDDRDALRDPGWPAMAFIEHRLAGDPTNWWVPNRAGIEAMLRSSGLRITARPGQEIYVCEAAPPGAPGAPPYDFTPELRAATGQAWR